MPTTINVSKPIEFKIIGGVENSRITVFNRTTGETIYVDDKSNALRIPDSGRVMFDASWFSDGWTVGDVVECKVSGINFGSATVTLTAPTATIQRTDVTVATNTLPAGGI